MGDGAVRGWTRAGASGRNGGRTGDLTTNPSLLRRRRAFWQLVDEFPARPRWRPYAATVQRLGRSHAGRKRSSFYVGVTWRPDRFDVIVSGAPRALLRALKARGYDRPHRWSDGELSCASQQLLLEELRALQKPRDKAGEALPPGREKPGTRGPLRRPIEAQLDVFKRREFDGFQFDVISFGRSTRARFAGLEWSAWLGVFADQGTFRSSVTFTATKPTTRADRKRWTREGYAARLRRAFRRLGYRTYFPQDARSGLWGFSERTGLRTIGEARREIRLLDRLSARGAMSRLLG